MGASGAPLRLLARSQTKGPQYRLELISVPLTTEGGIIYFVGNEILFIFAPAQ